MKIKIEAAQRLLVAKAETAEVAKYFNAVKDDKGRKAKTKVEFGSGVYIVSNTFPVDPGINVQRELVTAGEKCAADLGLVVRFKTSTNSADAWKHTMTIGKKQ